MVMVSLKYVIFVLRADNDGEGGILALLSLVAAERIADGARLPILVALGVIGASLLYGDGVITPAISVLSAMEGPQSSWRRAFEKFIVPVTLLILIGLFMISAREPRASAGCFGPSWWSGSWSSACSAQPISGPRQPYYWPSIRFKRRTS